MTFMDMNHPLNLLLLITPPNGAHFVVVQMNEEGYSQVYG